MAAPCFKAWNGNVNALTAPIVGTTVSNGVTTTVLQIAPIRKMRIVEWGFQFPAVPSSPVRFELLETGTVFATVTSGTNCVSTYNDGNGDAADVTFSTTATGFTATAEGTITASRLLDNKFYQSDLAIQFPLGREPEVNAGSCLRVRCTQNTGASLVVIAYVCWER